MLTTVPLVLQNPDKDLNTDLDPSVLALGFWAVTNDMIPSYGGISFHR